MSGKWDATMLADMRAVGDPLADAVVQELFSDGGIDLVNGLMRTLVHNDALPPEKLPSLVRAYLDCTASEEVIDEETAALGQDLFARLGPEMLTALAFYGLPMDYAAGKGVRVLHRTAYLAKRPVRRVLETTQMVVDVMSPGGLEAEGHGLCVAQKVRLMHAAVRYLIMHDRNAPWDVAELGVPINQEDLAGTLMTFACVVLAGLQRLGLEVSDEERDAYFRYWMVIGRIMGVHEALIPENFDEGRELAQLIFRGQGASSPQGRELASDLLQGYQRLLPRPLHGMPASMMHFFLQSEALTGRNIAEMLAVPAPDWTLGVTRMAAGVDHFLAKYGIDNPLASHMAGLVGRELVEGLIVHERANRAPYAIPHDLRQLWAKGPIGRAPSIAPVERQADAS